MSFADVQGMVHVPVEEADDGVALAGDHLNAERFTAEHGHEVRYAPEASKFFVWNAGWWNEDRLEQVPEMARQTIDGLRAWVAEANGESEFKRRFTHYTASSRSGRRDGLLAIARTAPEVVVAVDALDLHHQLLACRNGTVDLRTGELAPADPRHLLTRGVSIDFHPDARSDAWESFLSDIFHDDEDLIEYVHRLLGYAITGETGEHVLPVFHGEGANGKSTFVGAISDVLGDLAVTAPEGLLTEHRNEPHPERLAVLRGRRLVVSNELEQRATLAEQVVKALTGGDPISAREMYGRRYDFSPTHKIVVVTNHAPKVSGTDHAIWRRLRLVPFTVTIPVERQDHDLRRRLVEEHGEAILAWLVSGAAEWHRRGLGTTGLVEQATAAYRSREDVVGTFLAEMTVKGNERTQVGRLYQAWKSWAERAGERPGRQREFAAVLESRGITTESYRARTFVVGLSVSAGQVPSGAVRCSDTRKVPHEGVFSKVSGCDATSRDITPSEQGFQPINDGPDRCDLNFWSSPAADAYLASHDAEVDP